MAEQIQRSVDVRTKVGAVKGDQWYQVVKAVNTTKPTIGEILDQPQVEALINDGVKVTIAG